MQRLVRASSAALRVVTRSRLPTQQLQRHHVAACALMHRPAALAEATRQPFAIRAFSTSGDEVRA